jgi:dTDP-4-dehydrorhamnose reductase
MKVIVTGALGMLGHEAVKAFLMRGHEVVATDIASNKHRFDITDKDAMRALFTAIQPAWVINCAAYTNVDASEDHEKEAFSLNAKAPSLLANVCSENSVRLLHMSTDYVFDGSKKSPYTEHDTPNPVNAYGRSKLEGELAIADKMDDYLIIRTQWLFGLHGKNFVSTIVETAQGRQSVRVVNDQWGSPTYSKDLAKAMVLLVELDARGIYHVRNRGKATWYDLARKAIELFELETEVISVSTSEFPRPAKRPAYAILSTRKFTKTTGKLMPPWQISLKQYVQEYLQHSRS